jgi:hypothetical protein
MCSEEQSSPPGLQNPNIPLYSLFFKEGEAMSEFVSGLILHASIKAILWQSFHSPAALPNIIRFI